MNAAEDRLSELMDAATRALAPPIDTILVEGERLGRRHRRRRRTAVATGTAAVVLLVGAGAAVGLRLTGTNHEDDAAASTVVHRPSRPSRAPTRSGSASPSATADMTPTPTPTAGTYTLTLVPITSKAAVDILIKKLGSSWTYGPFNPANNAGTSLLDFDVNDGKGLARVFVGIAPVGKSGMDPIDCSLQGPLLKGGGTRPSGAPPASCNVQHYPNGDLAMQEVLKADAYGEYQYRIIANRADGVAVEITASNGDWSKAATEVTRVLPPLSVAQWTAIALDPAWQLAVPVNNAGIAPSP